jgi:hypothetical protein
MEFVGAYLNQSANTIRSFLCKFRRLASRTIAYSMPPLANAVVTHCVPNSRTYRGVEINTAVAAATVFAALEGDWRDGNRV